MIVSRVKLKNWRNFRAVDIALGDRAFFLGPNAAGKSNLLDVLRFLRDIAKDGGGLKKAISDRGGLSRIRCLAARKDPDVEITVELARAPTESASWRYEIGVKQQPRGKRLPFLTFERVYQDGKLILDRPNENDRKDRVRLSQTHLEQLSANEAFREVADFFDSLLYLHLVPQLLRFPDQFKTADMPEDPFGRRLLERITRTPEKTRQARLSKIEAALRVAVPQLRNLTLTKDEMGIPHLEALYEHWRPHAGKQREDQMSDGTLRLLALLWVLLDGDSLLLLEEPELSLHSAIVSKLPALIHRVQGKRKRQVLISSHSFDLLSDQGIGPKETFLLTPQREGTVVRPASSFGEVQSLLEGGIPLADALRPLTSPDDIRQLTMFEL